MALERINDSRGDGITEVLGYIQVPRSVWFANPTGVNRIHVLKSKVVLNQTGVQCRLITSRSHRPAFLSEVCFHTISTEWRLRCVEGTIG